MRNWLYLMVCLLAAGDITISKAQGGRAQMKEQDISALLQVAANPHTELPSRVSALDRLASLHDSKLVPQLHKLWDRPRPVPAEQPLDWDPQGAERVVDLHLILALGKSGDFSFLDQIATLVAQAGTVLQGPDNELKNAATVIKGLRRTEPITQITELAGNGNSTAQKNAVRTLQLLQFPQPPTGGAIPPWPELQKPLSFNIHRLAEELETIARLSGGRIELSSGARQWAATHDYDRGEVKREDTTLATVLEEEIDILDLTYAVEPAKIVILTFAEAGQRWTQNARR